ncbi:MAG: hypothetical protein R6W92_05405, partial [Desulfocurvibacter africanus]
DFIEGIRHQRLKRPDCLLGVGLIKLLGNRVGNASTVLYSRNNPGVILAEGRSVYNIRRGEPTGSGASA